MQSPSPASPDLVFSSPLWAVESEGGEHRATELDEKAHRT